MPGSAAGAGPAPGIRSRRPGAGPGGCIRASRSRLARIIPAAAALAVFASGMAGMLPGRLSAQDPAEVPAGTAEDAVTGGGQESSAVRLRLQDGTVVIGELDTESLHIATRFGVLDIPVASIVNLHPGLNSLPGIRQRLETLVEQLGDRDFKVRETAMGELVNWGPPVLDYLNRAGDGGSAERKKNLQSVIEQIQAAAAEMEQGGEEASPALIADDRLTTAEFTVVGKIGEQRFRVRTPYGELQVALADILGMDREWQKSSSNVRRSVDIGAMAFFQTTPVATGLRLRRGDRVRIRASGSVVWASWGNLSSGPDGIPNQGQWQSFNCGMLVARIGKSGEYTGIGNRNEFVARSDGELYLGVAMQDGYASQQGYQWTGGYKAQITVTSGAGE